MYATSFLDPRIVVDISKCLKWLRANNPNHEIARENKLLVTLDQSTLVNSASFQLLVLYNF